jgi:hypothetical protein
MQEPSLGLLSGCVMCPAQRGCHANPFPALPPRCESRVRADDLVALAPHCNLDSVTLPPGTRQKSLGPLARAIAGQQRRRSNLEVFAAFSSQSREVMRELRELMWGQRPVAWPSWLPRPPDMPRAKEKKRKRGPSTIADMASAGEWYEFTSQSQFMLML